MAWFKVDDKLWGSPKWLALKSGPRALWVTAGSYCMDQLTDGFVPCHVIGILGGKESDCVSLVKAGLWQKEPEGFRFHDWNDYQPSRESILDKREAEAARKAEWRRKRAAQRAASANGDADVTAGQDGDSGVSPAGVPRVSRSSRPDPTRPDPTVLPTEVHTTSSPDAVAPRQRDPYPDPDFHAFWEKYPRKDDKGQAFKAWKAARKAANPEAIIEGACRYADDPNREVEFTKYPATWLRAAAWENGPLPARVNGNGKSEPARPAFWGEASA